MRNQKLVLILLAAVFTVVAVTATPTWTRQQDGQPSEAKKKEAEDDKAPVATFNEARPATPEEGGRRREKGKRYDGLGVVVEQEPGIVVRPRSAHWTARVPAIPASQSDVVVVGEVVEAKAYLSNDKTGVYSEFTVKVSEVLKIDGRADISNNTLVAERAGGSVRFPSGQVQRIHVLYGQRMPEAGRRYLLFLKRTPGEQGLSILTGYGLRDARVSALDSTPPYTGYDGADEVEFLQRVREQISSPGEEAAAERRRDQ